jgi:alginate O-acetyltransferase complex protein AlgI
MFAVGWLGMRPAAFAAVHGKPVAGWRELIWRGAVRLVCGCGLIVLARFVWERGEGAMRDSTQYVLATALLLTGVSLALHFGLLNVLAGLWRGVGANCRALFLAPLYATSLTEFWGRRWNLAFSEMAAAAVFRPLRRWAGVRTATAAVFLFSGLLHELAISLPVRAGFGLPMLYFALHAAAVPVEQALARAGWAVDRVVWIGRLWTAAWLLLPLPLLFHAPFVRGCLLPMIS